MNQHIQGKIMLVTGGGQGLGAAICQSLAADGATVIVGDVNSEKAQHTVARIEETGGKAVGKRVDVSDAARVETVIREIVEEYGKLDVVVNNAGVDYTKSVEELTYEEWNRVMQVNLSGPFIVSKVVYPYLKKAGRGHIINIASTAAKRAWPNASAYHASKWGLLGFSHALHAEARQDGIKVTAVIAGGMRTPFLLDRFPDIDPNVLQDPRNVAETVKYVLCQPDETVIPEVTVIPMRETSWP